MYDLYDDLTSAINSLEDARDALKYFPDEKGMVEDILNTLEEKRDVIDRAVSTFQDKEHAAMIREYFSNL